MAKKILIVGGGPGGISAAVHTAKLGASVTVIDENPGFGGQIWRQKLGKVQNKSAQKWLSEIEKQSINFLPSTAVVGADENKLFCVSPEQGSFSESYDSLILANGARELFLPFPGWTLPNVIGCGGMQALVKSGLDVAGKRIVVSGSGPLLLAVAAYLKNNGAIITGIYEQVSTASLNKLALKLLISDPGKMIQGALYRLKLSGVPWKKQWWVESAQGEQKLESVSVTNGKQKKEIECDYLACAYGLVANLELAKMIGCSVEGNFLSLNSGQSTSCEEVYAVGELTGIGGVDKALLEGEIAALQCMGQSFTHLMNRKSKCLNFVKNLSNAFKLRAEVKALANAETIFCRCEDVMYQDICKYSTQRDAKLFTRCGMGACQGRVCSSMGKEIFGWENNKASLPLSPVSIDSLLE